MNSTRKKKNQIYIIKRTFLSLNMCRLPFPLVETFFSDAGALYLVLLRRADLLWISCLDYRQTQEGIGQLTAACQLKKMMKNKQ